MVGAEIHSQLFWIILTVKLVSSGARGMDHPCRFTHSNENAKWLHEDGGLRMPSYAADDPSGLRSEETASKVHIKARDEEKRLGTDEGACTFDERTRNLTCRGTIDFDYVKSKRNRRIRTFTVDDYKGGDAKRRRIFFDDPEGEGCENQITGDLRLADIHVELRVFSDVKKVEDNRFAITGEVFSNRLIKIGWKYEGEANRDSSNNVFIKAEAKGKGWRLHGHIRFDETGNGSPIRGAIIRVGRYPPRLGFRGSLNLKTPGGRRFDGQIEVEEVNISGTFSGQLTRCLTVDITIPENAFCGMTIENVEFKNSNFRGDFDSRSFEGIRDLRTIRFTRSKLELMPSYDAIFSGPSLKALHIEDSITPTMIMGPKCNVRNLEMLSFKGSGFFEFSNDSFLWLSCSNLTYLNLHETNFKLVSNDSILKPVCDSLKYLDISYSTLTLESSLSQIIAGTKITHLSLAGLQLKKVPYSALEGVKNTLEYLSLRKNNFAKIPSENILVPILSFPEMPVLKDLDLSRCRINYIEKGTFDSIANLQKLDISYNNIMNLQDGWVTTKPNVVHLNLSYNGADAVAGALKNSINLTRFESLETLDLSATYLGFGRARDMKLTGNLRRLSMCRCGLMDLSRSPFEILTNLIELDLSGNPRLGRVRDNLEPLKLLKSLKVLHLVCSGIVNFSVGPSRNFANLEYIDLSNNFIKSARSEFLRLFPNLKVLKLSRNSISYLPADFLTFSSRLETILLDDNKLDTLDPGFISGVVRLREISLGNNPFVCGCFVPDFLRRLLKTGGGFYLCPEGGAGRGGRGRSSGSNRAEVVAINETRPGTGRRVYRYARECVHLRDWTSNDYRCYSPYMKRSVPFVNVSEDHDVCLTEKEETHKDWVCATVMGSALFCFFVGFVWWKWWNIRFFARMLKNAAILSFASEDDTRERKSYQYNAFVSYSKSDRNWIIENLLPNLEKVNDIKICLHERDFQVGLSILENIITSIDRSRCIILVLSQAFVKSQWCQYEMHLAYHRLLETRRDQMILILLENIPRYKRPKTLHYLMMTKTYIEWPGSAKQIKDVNIFWDRLFKVLFCTSEIQK